MNDRELFSSEGADLGSLEADLKNILGLADDTLRASDNLVEYIGEIVAGGHNSFSAHHAQSMNAVKAVGARDIEAIVWTGSGVAKALNTAGEVLTVINVAEIILDFWRYSNERAVEQFFGDSLRSSSIWLMDKKLGELNDLIINYANELGMDPNNLNYYALFGCFQAKERVAEINSKLLEVTINPNEPHLIERRDREVASYSQRLSPYADLPQNPSPVVPSTPLTKPDEAAKKGANPQLPINAYYLPQ